MKLARLLRRDLAALTLRERAAALREGLNRREAVLGAAIVAAPIPAMAVATAEAHPDAALIALWQQWEEARRIERAAAARWDAIDDAGIALRAPETLYVQDGDDALGIASLAVRNAEGRFWYCVGTPDNAHRAGALRNPRRRQHSRPVRPEDNLPASAHTIVEVHPWPEAQARADAIVNANDEWRAEIARRNEASGHDAAREIWNACDTALSAIENEITATEARTLAGIVVKARLARSLDERGQQVSVGLLFEIICGLTSPNAPAA